MYYTLRYIKYIVDVRMQAIIPIFQGLVQISLFLISGLLLSYILTPRQGLLSRSVQSLLFSVCVTGILAVVLLAAKAFSEESFVVSLVCVDITLLMYVKFVLLASKKWSDVFETSNDRDMWFVSICAGVGAVWRMWFAKSLVQINDPYNYAFTFVGKSVPDLGFYTGMAADRVNYIGLVALEKVQQVFLAPYVFVHYWLTTFLFLGLVYMIVVAYRNSKVLARIAISLMCLGPIELFYALSLFTGHSLAYLCILPMFLFFKTRQREIYTICILMAVLMVCTYYTATIVTLLTAGGLVAAVILRGLLYKVSYVKQVVCFASIVAIASLSIVSNSSLALFSIGKLSDNSDVRVAINSLRSNQLSDTGEIVQNMTVYKDPTILGFSAIRWQMIFFFMCGCTLFVCLIKKRSIDQEISDLLFASIPVLIVSVSFFYANYPTRIFDYFAFFGLLVLCIPRRRYIAFIVAGSVFILTSSFLVAKDKRVFLSIPSGEVQGAVEISHAYTGVIFTDIVFANQLISNGYYKVTGTHDKDSLVYNLFYQKDKKIFAEAVANLHRQGVRFIALTKRMKDQYILMVNYPQQAMVNEDMYEGESLLKKVFDNGDVQLFLLDADDTQHKR